MKPAVVYTPAYELDLAGHIWPTAKYRLLAERLVAEGRLGAGDFLPPRPASWDDLALVHTPEYLHKVRTGSLSLTELVTLELPWVPGLVEGFRLMVGGTCDAAEYALETGRAAHLGGGLHHAFPDHGEGFCLFNDVAVAIRRLLRNARIRSAAVVDCDVHHGNGTAAVFARDESVFTFSIHQEHNYPLVKPASSLDIGLPDGAGDELYLEKLAGALPAIVEFHPELVVYLAGADPYRGDRLGGLALTFDGLRTRDRLVFDACARASAPVVVVLAGGYAENVEDTVEVHAGTIAELRRDV